MVKLKEQIAIQILHGMKDQQWQFHSFHVWKWWDWACIELFLKCFSKLERKKEQHSFEQKCGMTDWISNLLWLFYSCLIPLAVVQKRAVWLNTQKTCANHSITYFNWWHVFTYSAFNICPEMGSLTLTHPFMHPTYKIFNKQECDLHVWGYLL